MVERSAEEFSLLRHDLYRFFAGCLWPPRQGGLETLRQAAATLEQGRLHEFAFFGPWQGLSAYLRQARANGLAEEYGRLFLPVSGKVRASPYSSSYLGAQGRDSGLVLAAVERAYKAMGFAFKSRLKEMPDHASVQLEAMAQLCDREAIARAGEQRAAVAEALKFQRKFLSRHILSWFSSFSNKVTEADQGPFYTRVVAATGAFLDHEAALLDELLRLETLIPEAVGP